MLQLLETLYRERILDPVEVHRIFLLKNEILLELRQLEVYEVELLECSQPQREAFHQICFDLCFQVVFLLP